MLLESSVAPRLLFVLGTVLSVTPAELLATHSRYTSNPYVVVTQMDGWMGPMSSPTHLDILIDSGAPFFHNARPCSEDNTCTPPRKVFGTPSQRPAVWQGKGGEEGVGV